MNFIDAITIFLFQFFDHPVLGYVIGGMMCGALCRFAVTKRPEGLVSAVSAFLVSGVWMGRYEFARQVIPDVIRGLPAHDSGSDTSAIAAGFLVLPALGLIVALIDWAVAGMKVKQIAGPVAGEDLKPVAAWASGLDMALPKRAHDMLASIRAQLNLMAEQVKSDSPIVGEMTRTANDLRDLLVQYKRVEAARRMLPGNSTASEDLLMGGLTRIERSIVEKREEIAKAEEQQLQIQGRYIELKHEQPN